MSEISPASRACPHDATHLVALLPSFVHRSDVTAEVVMQWLTSLHDMKYAKLIRTKEAPTEAMLPKIFLNNPDDALALSPWQSEVQLDTIEGEKVCTPRLRSAPRYARAAAPSLLVLCPRRPSSSFQKKTGNCTRSRVPSKRCSPLEQWQYSAHGIMGETVWSAPSSRRSRAAA